MQYDPVAEDPAYYARTPYGQAPNRQAAHAQAPYGQTPYGQTPYGQPPDAQTPYAQTPYGQVPYDQMASDYVSVFEADQKQKSRRGPSGWATVAMVIAAVLVMLVIVLGTALLTENIGESLSTTVAQEFPEVYLPHLRVVLPKPVTTTESTPSPVVTTTTPPTTAPPTTSTTTIAPPTPKKVGKQPLVCIMGEKLTSVHQFPPDEVCDYIFYDSLYKGGNHNLLRDQNTFTESLNTFLNSRRGYRHTTLGIGFSFYFLARAEIDLKKKNPSPLEHFWGRAIFHAGILDTPVQPTRLQTKYAVEILKKLNRLLDVQRSRGATVITAISVPLPEVAWAASFAKEFRELNFTPSLFISIGHYRLGDDRGVCFIVPQTRHPDDIPPRGIPRDYSFNVSTPMYQLRWLYSNGTDTKGVVSVTLKGRWAHPVSSKNVTFYDACWSEAIPFGSYTEVCPVGSGPPAAPLVYSIDHFAMITYVAKIDRTFTYDNERAFAEKLCRVKALGTNVPFGIAVYDVDYDDYYNKCSSLNLYGAHSRLKALRKVVNYFKSHAAPFSEIACRTFVLS